MDARWLNIIGLGLELIGVGILSYGLIISKKSAIELGVSRWSGAAAEEKLKLPKVKDRLKQSKNAIRGLIFLVFGFILQILANWPNA